MNLNKSEMQADTDVFDRIKDVIEAEIVAESTDLPLIRLRRAIWLQRALYALHAVKDVLISERSPLDSKYLLQALNFSWFEEAYRQGYALAVANEGVWPDSHFELKRYIEELPCNPEIHSSGAGHAILAGEPIHPSLTENHGFCIGVIIQVINQVSAEKRITEVSRAKG